MLKIFLQAIEDNSVNYSVFFATMREQHGVHKETVILVLKKMLSTTISLNSSEKQIFTKIRLTDDYSLFEREYMKQSIKNLEQQIEVISQENAELKEKVSILETKIQETHRLIQRVLSQNKS